MGSFHKFGYRVRNKKSLWYIIYNFFINFKFSKINKISFLVTRNSAVNLKFWYSILGPKVNCLVEIFTESDNSVLYNKNVQKIMKNVRVNI